MFFDSLSTADKPSSFPIRNSNSQLSPDKYLQSFHTLLQQVPINEEGIIHYLKFTPDVLMLINLAVKDEKLALWCEHEKMKEYWNEVWRRVDRNPTLTEAQQNSALIYRGLRPQINISSFRLICGLTLFSSAEHLIDKGYAKNSQQVISFLKQASELGSYDALNALTNINIDKLHKHELEVPEIILTPLYNAALWHGTPVYLLCATAHYYIANYYSSLDKIDQSQQAYQNALTYLYIANYCEASSEDEIYNAYNGAGISAGNIWEIDNIEQLIDHLTDESKIDMQSISQARFAAYRLAQNYLNSRHVNTAKSPILVNCIN